MTKNSKNVVITGAPGTGKTTLIKAFSAAGYPVVEEGATAVMRKTGVREPHLLPDKLRSEFRNAVVAHYKAAQDKFLHNGLTFFDRSDIEALAYAEFEGRELPEEFIRQVSMTPNYNEVFILSEFPGEYVHDDFRRLPQELSAKLGKIIRQTYLSLDLSVNIIDEISMQERIEKICRVLGISDRKESELQVHGKVVLN